MGILRLVLNIKQLPNLLPDRSIFVIDDGRLIIRKGDDLSAKDQNPYNCIAIMLLQYDRLPVLLLRFIW